MSEKITIGALLNTTYEGLPFVKGMRRLHPDDNIVAIISPRTVLTEEETALVDEVLRLEISPVRMILRGKVVETLSTLRARKFDLFLVRFSTLKLRLLAVLVAPRHCELWLPNGSMIPASTSFMGTCLQYFARRWSGVRLHLKAFWNAYMRPIRKG